MRDPMQRLVELTSEGRPAVMVTVVSAAGSAPRKGGAKLVMDSEGGFVGTVGGGAVEHAILGRRDEWFALEAPSLIDFDLGRDLGMACGGEMQLLVEPFGAEPRLVLFGAGHVGMATARVARMAGFRVVVVDDREEWATRENFPDAARVIVAPLDGSSTGVDLDEQDFVVIATYGHGHDFEMADRILREPHRYLGVIGSRRKRRAMRDYLCERGHDEAAVEGIHSPVGIDIGSETVPEIAVSLVGELIRVRRLGA